jgi:hypothetical protein
MEQIINDIKTRFSAADTYLGTKRDMWDQYEHVFHNALDDSISDKTKSQVFDPKLATYVLERSYRVMSQMMVGKVKAISKNDEGASKLMNLILEKYIIPNANAQWDFLTKCRMVDTYSNIYGNFFALIDWDIKTNGYRGPDMWLIPIRDVFPQVGAVSLEDSEYIIIRSWRNISYFKGLKKQDSFKNISTVVDKLSKIAGDKGDRDTYDKTQREEDHYPDTDPVKGKGYYEVLSMFERDRWVDYVTAADEVIRDTKNPHDDGELPVVNKFSIPLLDDIIGMGDFERGLPMQYTLNSAWNLYLDAVKISIFPPVLLNKDNIASMSSIKFGPAAKWLVRNNISNTAQTLNLTPQGINSFNNVYQLANASIMNMFGTSDTSISEQTDPGLGKTPRALNMQAQRQNSRDTTDRFYMEQFLTKVAKKFVNLMSKNQSKSVQVRMFRPEIEQLARSYEDIADMYDEKTGKLTIKKSQTGSLLYDYEIVPGSTYLVDQNKQNENLSMLLELLMKNPQMTQVLQQEGMTVKLGELFKRIVTNSGIQDWDKILEEEGEGEKGEGMLKQHEAQLQQFIAQLQGGMPAQPGMQNPNEVPSQPSGMEQLPQMPQGQEVNFGG